MKFPRTPDPTRWRDRGADAHALESRAAVLAEAASQTPPLGPQALARIRTQVLASRRTGGDLFHLAALPARARLALGVGLILACAATAGGASILWRRHVTSAGRVAAPPAGKTPRPISDRASRIAPRKADLEPAAPTIALAGSAPIEAEAGVQRPLPRSHLGAPIRSNVLPAMAPPPTEASEVAVPTAPTLAPVEAPPAKATEAGLVAEALSQLRQRHDPRAALATLDRYGQAFPHGVLETEALRTRVEVVVQLHDFKAALSLLDGTPALSDRLGADLLLTRAELRASAGRFREALPDFTQVLDGAAGPPAAGGEERALYGRAVCLGRLAQDDRAVLDLRAYQQRFPQGRFAVEVRRLLAGSQRP